MQTLMSMKASHVPSCSLSAPLKRWTCTATSKPHAFRQRQCNCCAEPQNKSPFAAAHLIAFFSAPAAFAEEVQQKTQQAVEQGQQLAEQFQQQYTLPPELNDPSETVDAVRREPWLNDFVNNNPNLIAAGLAILAIGGVVAGLVGQGVKVKQISPAKAFDLLSNDRNIVFIDLRSKADVKETGSPDLRSVKRKTISLPYTVAANREVVEGFSEKLLKLSAVSADTEVILFDAYGTDAKGIAKTVTEGVKQVYWVTGGENGAKGWKASQLPWREPSRGFSFNLGNFSGLNVDKLAEDFKSKPTLTKAGLAVGAVGAAAVVLFNEVEVVLEVLGVAAAGNFIARKLLFAKDREQTVDQIRDIVDNKIAAGEVGSDLKRVSDTLVDAATETERTVEKNVSPKVRKTVDSAKDSAKKTSSNVDSQTKDLQSSAKSVSKDLQKSAEKVADKTQQQAQELQSKGKEVEKDVKSEAKSLSKDVQKGTEKAADKTQQQSRELQSKGRDAAKDVKSEAKSLGKDVQEGADKAQQQSKDLQSKGKDASKEVQSSAKSASEEAQKTADKANEQARTGAQQAQSQAGSAKDSSQQNFEQQKAEVINETKGNVQEAESTLQAKGSNNGAGPGVPSQQDVKEQAKEARGWINSWRKKQPVKTSN